MCCDWSSRSCGARYEKACRPGCFPHRRDPVADADPALSPDPPGVLRRGPGPGVAQYPAVSGALGRRRGRRRSRRPGRFFAPLAEQDRDHDPLVGVHPGGLGPASAADARAALRNRHRSTPGERPGGVSFHRAHAFRRGIVGMGESEQRHAHRGRPARSRSRGVRRNSAEAGAGMTTMPAATTTAHCEAVLDEIERVVVGKRSALTLIRTAVLAHGHVLIEDLPGLGKTLIARSFAAALGLRFTRVQFTPDLLPADLLGSTIYDMQSGRFAFRAGPIFTNLLLADEINRTPPKTQAALLEAMAEGQVSIDGETHKLPAPFIVLATDNPIEYEGTYPLPEAQLDRFAMRLELRYLSERDETSMLRRRLERGSAEPTVNQVRDAHDLLAMRESVEQDSVHDDVLHYVVALATATRHHPQVAVGASPRAELDLVQLARARALLLGRDYVIPEDVKALAVAAVAHRITLRPEMWVRKIQGADVIEELLRRLPVPRTGGGHGVTG